MINYMKFDGALRPLNGFEKNCWVKVTTPDPDEIQYLVDNHNVPLELIHDILDVDERSRLEIEEDWVLVIIRIPIYHPNNGLPFVTIPLGILLSEESVITVCLHDSEVMSDMISAINLRKAAFENKINFILDFLFIAATWYLRYLKQINFQTNLIEQDLEKSTKNEELHRLLKMEKCLVYFITSLKSNENFLLKLKGSKFARLNEYDEDLMEDVLIENKQAIDMANIYSDILSGMMDAFASVISNNLNNVMKQLTSITIILMIPTLISSFFGMNVPNLMEQSHFSFLLIFALSFLISLGGVIMFRKRKWF